MQAQASSADGLSLLVQTKASRPVLDQDQQVVQQVLVGDREAFAVIVNEHHQAIRHFITLHCQTDGALVDDLAQDVFVVAYKDLKRWQPQQSRLRSWLIGIARHRCLNYLRQQKRRQGHHDRLQHFLLQQDLNRLAAMTHARDVQPLLTSLQACVGALSAPLKQLLNRRYRDGCAFKELAADSQQTETALRMRLSRLRRRLKECIEQRMATDRDE